MARVADEALIAQVEELKEKYKDKTAPPWGPLGEEVYLRSYSRVKQDGSRESWLDTVARVVIGNCGFVDPRFIGENEVEELFEYMYQMKVLPGGRHLWVTGVPNRNYVSNCWAAGWEEGEFATHFTWTFSRLMEGGGVGSNYSDVFFKRFKSMKRKVDVHIVCEDKHADHDDIEAQLSTEFAQQWWGCHSIEDSREGWVEALQILLDYYWLQDGSENLKVNDNLVFDVSRVRAKGSALKQFGGTASGPEALVTMLLSINRVMNGAFDEGGRVNWKLGMLLDHEIASCVVAGNIRRSARMSMKHWDDIDILDFINLKQDSKSHWTTNISVVVDDSFWRSLNRKNGQAKAIMRAIAEGIYHNGEPGICDATYCNKGELLDGFFSTNPCGELPLPEWGSCNLGHVNLDHFSSDHTGMLVAFRLMTRFLLRATFSDIPDPLAKRIMERDRRLGVGFTGFHYWLLRQGVRYSEYPSAGRVRGKLEEAQKDIKRTARDYAFEMRIPEPIKTTTVAPTGTSSKLAGCSEGIQPIYSPYFIRRVRYGMSDPTQAEKLRQLREAGYFVEKDDYSPNTQVVSYICQDRIMEELGDDILHLVESSNEVALPDFLSVQAAVQSDFVDNAVSITVNFDSEQYTADDIYESVRQHGGRVKGMTMMPSNHGYSQPPLEVIDREKYEKLVNRVESSGQNVSSLQTGAGAMDCKNGVCEIVTKTAGEDERAPELKTKKFSVSETKTKSGRGKKV